MSQYDKETYIVIAIAIAVILAFIVVPFVNESRKERREAEIREEALSEAGFERLNENGLFRLVDSEREMVCWEDIQSNEEAFCLPLTESNLRTGYEEHLERVEKSRCGGNPLRFFNPFLFFQDC